MIWTPIPLKRIINTYGGVPKVENVIIAYNLKVPMELIIALNKI